MDEHTPDQPADETSVTTKAPRATRTSRTAATTTGETPSTTPSTSTAGTPTAETPTAETPTAPRGRTREAAKESPTTPAAEVHTTQLPTTPAAPVTAALPTQPAPAGPAASATSPARPVRSRPGDLGTRRTEPLPVDRAAVVAEPTVPTNIYRARRPIVAVFLVIPAVAVGLLLIRALAISAFGPAGFRIDGVIASSLALSSLPLLVAGLYGLITGAAHGSEHYGFKVWARPPLAYLLVGIAFVTAAGIAIR